MYGIMKYVKILTEGMYKGCKHISFHNITHKEPTRNVYLIGEHESWSLQQKRVEHLYFVEQIAEVIGRGSLVLTRDVHHIE